METIQVVLDQQLLREADKAAKRSKINRSALIRDALRVYLKQLQVRELELREAEGYKRCPDLIDDAQFWEKAAAWPAE